ncbi:MAG: sigma-54 dependent transcriptional regulator [Planctomycetota bacterium]
MSRVLIIDDEESICWGLAKLCEQMSHESETVSSAELGLELASKQSFDLIITDVRLPGINGIEAIKRFRELNDQTPIITITAFGDLETAVDAIQQGAFEYIVKPFDLESVRLAIQRAITTKGLLTHEAVAQENSTQQHEASFRMVGTSAVMQEVFKQIALTTTSDAPVLITGESGTGKENTARAIHQFGPRSEQPFVAVNIAALSPSLAESELFGHVKGAFTGADSDRVGLIQQADGGTLFLDEVADIPLDIQVKLLRVLDQGEVAPVGSNKCVKTNFRLISATNQELLSQVNHGEFRQDLFYRLRTFEIKLPPLRQRKEDIPALVQHFLQRQAYRPTHVATQEFISKLQSKPWQGNIRELQSVVERAATLSRNGLLSADLIHDTDSKPAPDSNHEDASKQLVDQLVKLVETWTEQRWTQTATDDLYEQLIATIEPAILQTAFRLSENAYSAAARRLGIHRTTLKKKLTELSSQNETQS